MRWANIGKVQYRKTPGNQFRYWLETPSTTAEHIKDNRIVIVYTRVSSAKQRSDLERQGQYFSEKYPGATIISDVGSGLNFKRPALQSLLEYIALGKVSTVVISHKDRVSRFGFEWFQSICANNNVDLVLLNDKNNKFKSPKDEFVEDLLAISHSFSSKIYSNRKYTGSIGGTVETNPKTS